MGLPLAWSTLTTDTITEGGKELIRIRMVTQSYRGFSHIYKVDDLTEVILNPITALPIRLDLKINEGSISKSHLTTFYHDKKVAIFQDRISKDIKEVPIESDTQEIFCFLYAARNRDLESLSERKYTLFVDGKLHDLGLKAGIEDGIKLPTYGIIPSLAFEPTAEFDGLFLRQGKVRFWVSKQNRRMVTCIQAKVSVGKVSVKLQSVSGPGDGFWINNK